MANAFEASVAALAEAGEPLSAILREFAEAFDSLDRETGQMIREIADIHSESEYTGRISETDEEGEDE